MATSKQYEILFMLKAQMDSAFGTGFNSARTYLTELQGKVRDYNNTLRDISAYQRVQSSMQALQAKINNNGTATAQQTAKLQDYKRRLREIETELQKSGVDTANLTEEEKRLQAAVEEATKEMQDFTALKNQVTDLANAFSVMKVGADLAFNAVKQIDQTIVDCIQSAGELEYTMSAVQGISGATARETEQLTALAKDMGATTIYTASQCAEALQTEALAGWSVEEMLNGLPAVIKLAAASGEDLTTMTGIISDSLNAFGLQGEEAVTKFADVLTKAATSSNTNVSLMGESLSYVESTAANLDYSIEDVSVALAVMANNALKGSVSGSALNTMLTRMSGANENAAAEMDALGISMYDADGQAKDLMTFLNELRGTFKDFGDDAQAAQISAYKLAGQRGMRGLLSIVRTSDEEWQQMVDDIYAYQGAADEISGIRLDNYRGQIYLLESAWDALKTTVGEGYLPVATGAAEVMTDLTTATNDFVAAHQDMLVPLGAGVTAFGAAAGVIGAVGTSLQFAKYALDAFMPGMAAMIVKTGGIALAIGAVAGLGAALATYIATMDNASESYRELRDEAEEFIETAEDEKEKYVDLIATYEERRDKANALIDTIQALSEEDQNNAWTQRQMKAAVDELNETLPDLNLQYDALNGTLSETTDHMRDVANTKSDKEQEAGIKRLIELRTKQKEALEKATEARLAYEDAESKQSKVTPDVTITGTISSEDFQKMQQVTADTMAAKSAENDYYSAYNEYTAQIEELEAEYGDYIQVLEEVQKVEGLTAEQIEEITTLATDYGEAWSDAYTETYDALSKQFDLLSEAKKIEETSLSDVKSNLDEKKKQWEEYQQNIQTILNSGIDVSPIVDDLTSGSADAMSFAAAAAEDVKSTGGKVLQDIAGEAKGIHDTIGGISGTLADLQPKVESAKAALEDALQLNDAKMAADATAAAKNVLLGYVSGLGETEGVTTATTSMGELTISTLQASLGEHSPSVYAEEAGENVDQGLINGLLAKESAILSMVRAIGSATTSSFVSSMPYSAFYNAGSNAVQAAINGINAKRRALISAVEGVVKAASSAKSAGSGNVPGFASGTMSAPPGLAVVGENGPELMMMQGGERIIPADETRRIMNNTPPAAVEATQAVKEIGGKSKGTVIQLTYAPVVQAAAGTEGNIREQLSVHDTELIELIGRLLDEREAAQSRRAY